MLVYVMKKPRRRRRNQKVAGPWMRALALMAAESKVDGGVGLQLLLHYARFDERPQLSLTKRVAA
jgi:hypothetical protein